jgi:hypothetical protein
LIEDIIIYNPRFHIFEKFKIKAPIVPWIWKKKL